MAKIIHPSKRIGDQVCIKVSKKWHIFENFEDLIQLIEDWKAENPDEEILGTPQYHFTPISSGRDIVINCITFSLK